MASARELLEQADALMRRNRSSDADGEDTGSGIPLLTEVAGPGIGRSDRGAGAGAGGGAAGGANAAAIAGSAAPFARPPVGDPSAGAVDDIPVLTDVVADLEPISVMGAPQDGGEPSQWPDFAVREPHLDPWTVGGPMPPPSAARALVASPVELTAVEATAVEAPAAEPAAPVSQLSPAAEPVSAVVVPVVGLHDVATPVPVNAGAGVAAPDPLAVFALLPDTVLEPTHHAPAAAANGGAGEAARWEALAEEVRMQVLQRIDIFTDTGLQEQLTARLQPIVDRASADLVATINQQVGQLLRAYVAEAIEREIDKWKQDGA
jgi:hypothetical protein